MCIGIKGTTNQKKQFGAVQIKLSCFLYTNNTYKITLGLTRHDSRQVKDDTGPILEQLLDTVGIRNVDLDGSNGGVGPFAGVGKILELDSVRARQNGNRLVVQLAVLGQPIQQLAPNKTGSSEDKHVHCVVIYMCVVVLSYNICIW